MKYCKKCVNVDTRPDGQFDENGVCPACRFTEEKKIVRCSSSLCKGQIRLKKNNVGFIICPHCGYRFHTNTY